MFDTLSSWGFGIDGLKPFYKFNPDNVISGSFIGEIFFSSLLKDDYKLDLKYSFIEQVGKIMITIPID